MTSLADLAIRARQIVEANSTGILTGIGMTGVVTTAVLTARASFEAARMITEKEAHITGEKLSALEETSTEKVGEILDEELLTPKEKVELVWPQFIPPVISGVATMGAIFMANRLSSKEAAALAAAYGLSDKAFQEYKEKVVERLGEGKEKGVRDEIAQDRVNANPPQEIVIDNNGDVLCHDTFTGRYFSSNMQKLRKAEVDTNMDIVHHSCCSASRFYDRIGLPAIEMTDTLGFNLDHTVELSFSSVLSPDGRPCISFSFATLPVAGWDRLY